MKKKKINNLKGFTLIELLAVIVILAIIALIAVPQVLKILNKSRLSAAEDSTYGIVKSAETYVSNFLLKNSGTLPSEDLVFECNGTSCNLTTTLTGYELDGLEKLEFKGTKPKSGKVIISNSGSDIQASLVINNYSCSYINGKSECLQLTGPTSYTPLESDIGYTGVLKVVYLDPTNLDKGCNENNINSDTGTKIGCMKWYAYADDGENYTMILDHDLSISLWCSKEDYIAAGGTEEEYGISGRHDKGPITAIKNLANDTMQWQDGLQPRLIKVEEILNIIDYPLGGSTAPNSVGWFFLDSKTRNPGNEEKYRWLSGGLYKKNGIKSEAFLTSDFLSSTNNYVFAVSSMLVHFYVNDDRVTSLRPVITVPKNKIS